MYIQDLNIRTAGASDAPAVRDLTRAAYAKWVSLIGREPLPMTADYAEAIIKHRIDLGHAREEFVGLVEMVFEPDCLLIENLAIHPDHQGQGFGRSLLNHVETIARERQQKTIRLYTNSLFVANISFYLMNGYKIDRHEPFRGGQLVHMSKFTSNG